MLKRGTIILPIAGRSSRFAGTRPKWMLSAPTGELMLEMSLKPLPEWRQHRVVIGALQEHLVTLGGESAVRKSLGEHPEIVVFDEVTKGPAETVSQIIQRANIDGPIFIKDCDSWFVPDEDVFDNVVCVTDLRRTPNVRNIPGKSFVKVNENGLITGIFEKTVSSNFVSVGGYGFNSVADYLRAYDGVLRDYDRGEPFVSHVILEAIRNGTVFRSLNVTEYTDVGTLEAWQEFRERSSLYLVDLDGVMFRNSGAYLAPLWSDPDVPLTNNVEALRKLQFNGCQIVFLTARPERYRDKTEAALRELGLKWHAIVFGLNHTRRFLINDYAPSNPYPSAVAINLPRNDDKLESLL